MISFESKIYPSPLSGLKISEVHCLQNLHGFNELPIKDSRTIFKITAQVISEPMFLLLLLAGFVYLLIGNLEDAAILMGFIAISISITIYQEHKSEKAIDALKNLSSPRALVLRDGQIQRIAGRDLVVGDHIILEEGDRIAADAILTESHDLLVDESLLTGESEPIDPKFGQLVYSGTLVIRGGGSAIVRAIGMQTEIGKIGKCLGQINNAESPLQADIKILIKRFAIFGLTLSLLVFLIYGVMYKNWLGGALSGISLTMALLPQEFTVILTVFLALGVWRISQQHVLTRYAPVIETLGSINILCVDKTGTLTQNKMSLQALATPNKVSKLPALSINFSPHDRELLNYAVLASKLDPFDPMEKALYEAIKVLNPEQQSILKNYSMAHEYGLSHELPAMTHLWAPSDKKNEYIVAIKGSPEAVIKLCNMTEEKKGLIELQIIELASQGLRLLGVAKAQYQKNQVSWPNSVKNFHFEWLGLVGLKDPLRLEVPESVAQCHAAGIRIIMITGDHAITAQAIARQAGISSNTILSGKDIDGLNDKNLQNAIKRVSVFVRIKPEQKLRIVKALQENHEIVAMTGDGVNDAPALKAAHVGIAMGKHGTDVAREASSLVLLNDDFSSIVNTIRQGRQIYDNLHKAIMYVVAVHIPIAGAVFLPLIFGAPPMLTPIHILFLEMIIDPSCAIIFEMEEPELNVMHKPPRNPSQRIFSINNLLPAILQGIGLMMIVVSIYLGLIYHHYPANYASTIAFGALVLGNLLLIIVSRSKNLHFFEIIKIKNSAQYWIIGLATSLYLVLIFSPFFRERFQFSELNITGVWLIIFSGFIGLLWCEGIKKLTVLISSNQIKSYAQ